MAKDLKVSEDLLLPLDTVTSTLVVYGGKGMGKTNFGGVLVEEMASAGLRWSVLDPMGVWWGIRHSVDGKGRGVECLILGGAHGDIPIEPTGGAVVADLVVDERVNVIIDISRKADGEMWSIGERIRFATEYGRHLFKRQGGLVDGRRREPIFQLIDEAARFIPQVIRSGDVDAAKCESVWSTIAEEGRNVGLGVGLLTQRSARLNKNVAELADVMMAFRTVGPNSVAAVMDWLGEHLPKARNAEVVQQLRSLAVGSCLVVSPGWLQIEKVAAIRRRNTFDSSATPKPGQAAVKVRGEGAKPDLALYATRMRETIERAKEDDPKALKARIRELEKAAAKPAPVAVAIAAKQADSAALIALRTSNSDLKTANADLKRKLEDRQRKANRLVEFMAKTMKPFVGMMEKMLEEFKAEAPVMPIAEVFTLPALPVPTSLQMVPTRTSRVEARAGESDPPVNGKVKLRGKSVEMLRVCARMYPKGLTEAQVASQAGIKKTGGTFSDYKSLLRTSGSVRFDGGLWYATEEGMRRAGTDIPSAPSTTAEVLAIWLPKMRGKAKDMLQYLVAQGGANVSREELGSAVGVAITGGTFSDYLSLLRTADLIITDSAGIRANPETLLL